MPEDRAVVLANIYAPCVGMECLENFLEDLEGMVREVRDRYRGWNITTIRMGDFNAITSPRDIRRRTSQDTGQGSQTCSIDEYLNNLK